MFEVWRVVELCECLWCDVSVFQCWPNFNIEDGGQACVWVITSFLFVFLILFKIGEKCMVQVMLSWWLLMLALKASTVTACGICEGKLFHVNIVLGEKLYLKAIILILYGWKPRGEYGRVYISFSWRYGWDVIATTPFTILYSMISLEMVLLSSKVFQFRKFIISVTLLVLWYLLRQYIDALSLTDSSFRTPPWVP